MKSLKYLHICVKVFRVVTFILTAIMLALAIANAVFLAAWISYDDISFIHRSDFYRQILTLTDAGSYYYNVSLYASELIFSVIKSTLLIYLIQLFNAEIKEGNPFSADVSKMSRWLGIRMFVFPVIGFVFATFISVYLNQGVPVQLIDISFLGYGAFFVLLSFLLKCGIDKSHNCEEQCESKTVKSEEFPVVEVDELNNDAEYN